MCGGGGAKHEDDTRHEDGSRTQGKRCMSRAGRSL
jgi:hypothetical protein